MADIYISVCVPVFNVEKYIERCARSAFEQTMKTGVEFIFVDDCSPDRSIEILKQVLDDYPERKQNTHIIYHKENKGLAWARKTAIINAKGEFITHLDSDDYIPKDALQSMYDKAKETNADIVVGDVIRVSKHNQLLQKTPIGLSKEKYIEAIICRTAPCYVVSRLIRKDIYTKNDIIIQKGLDMGEDYVTTPQLLYYAKRISFIEKPVYNYDQQNNNSYTQSVMTTKKIDNVINAISILTDFFRTKENEYLRLISPMHDYNMVHLIGCCRHSIRFIKYLEKNYPWEYNNTPLRLNIKDKIVWVLYCNRKYYTIVLLSWILKQLSPIYHLLQGR